MAGPSGGAAQAHGPDLSHRPPAGALPSLPAARRVTAAAPPPSWAWQALPSPAGSGQPRPQRGRAAPAFLPQGSRGREFLQTLVLFTPSVLFGIPKALLVSVSTLAQSSYVLGKYSRV